MQLIKAKDIKIIKTKNDNKSDKEVDILLMDMAKNHPIIVATQDSALKASLKKDAKAIISLRQKKYLALSKDL